MSIHENHKSMPRSDEMTWLETLRGKRTRDIELPNESGKRDPRLPRGPDEQLKRLYGSYKEFKQEQDPIKGLQRAKDFLKK